jgi:hypothetical protein
MQEKTNALCISYKSTVLSPMPWLPNWPMTKYIWWALLATTLLMVPAAYIFLWRCQTHQRYGIQNHAVQHRQQTHPLPGPFIQQELQQGQIDPGVPSDRVCNRHRSHLIGLAYLIQYAALNMKPNWYISVAAPWVRSM